MHFENSPPRHRTSTQHESTNQEDLAAMYRRLCVAPHPGFAHLRLRHLKQIYDLFSWFLSHTVRPLGAPRQWGCQVKLSPVSGEMCILKILLQGTPPHPPHRTEVIFRTLKRSLRGPSNPCQWGYKFRPASGTFHQPSTHGLDFLLRTQSLTTFKIARAHTFCPAACSRFSSSHCLRGASVHMVFVAWRSPNVPRTP